MNYAKIGRGVLVFGLLLSPIFGCSKPTENAEAALIHPRFALTLENLAAMTGDLPETIGRSITSQPWYFLRLMSEILNREEDLFYLVDKEHSLDAFYEPGDLVNLSDYPVTVGRSDLTLRRLVIPDVLAMVESARIDGVELVFSSAYRSYTYQDEVYARNVATYGLEQAERESAKPGRSQHQLGSTIDLGSIDDSFGLTDAGLWMSANAWKFGFSQSYPEDLEDLTGYRHEIWHYRYITRAGTLLEREFFGGVQHYLLTFLHTYRGLFAEAVIR